mmetsp:Transcript_9600/g.13983  ORF Transcript_9600/g.13983 Transcript_9600/m.13983 type:complete len:134 (-) Transcript_9600:337-738(-)
MYPGSIPDITTSPSKGKTTAASSPSSSPTTPPAVPLDFQIADQVSKNVSSFYHDVLNQPSIGLYYVQKNILSMVPRLVKSQSSMVDLARSVQMGLLDLNDSLSITTDLQYTKDQQFSRIEAQLDSVLALRPKK